MIKAVSITNHRNETIRVVMANPEATGFAITKITGLGPVAATINITNFSITDGGVYNSSRLPPRMIEITIEALWSSNYDIEELRHKSYKYFPIKKKVSLIFETDERNLSTEGFIEKNEPEIFSNRESYTISIKCPDPYFYGANINNTFTYNKMAKTGTTFQFPFSNNSLENKLLKFNDLIQTSFGTLNYIGDVETGFTVTAHFLDEVDDESFEILNQTTGKSMKVNLSKIYTKLGSKIKRGDELIISTMSGYKTMHIRRDNQLTNVLTYLNMKDANFAWLTVVPGENEISYTMSSPSRCQLTITYPILYEGV